MPKEVSHIQILSSIKEESELFRMKVVTRMQSGDDRSIPDEHCVFQQWCDYTTSFKGTPA